ncbi:MAG: hypothetical protein WAW96_11305 [Alphaproteobacteria bacterium]
MMKLNTIDLDIHPNHITEGKFLLDKVLKFLINCESCLGVEEPKDSDSKGYHIIFYCKKDCDICRLLFDDSKRFMMDYDRIEERKNVMFDAKHVKLNETQK